MFSKEQQEQETQRQILLPELDVARQEMEQLKAALRAIPAQEWQKAEQIEAEIRAKETQIEMLNRQLAGQKEIA